MAKATREPGIPAVSRVKQVVIHGREGLRKGDTVTQEETEDVYPRVERLIEEPAIPAKVVLELTEEEAVFLRDVTMAIGGDGLRTRRRFATAIGEALHEVDVMPSTSKGADDIGSNNRAIYFTAVARADNPFE
jgi:hypothetical protein